MDCHAQQMKPSLTAVQAGPPNAVPSKSARGPPVTAKPFTLRHPACAHKAPLAAAARLRRRGLATIPYGESAIANGLPALDPERRVYITAPARTASQQGAALTAQSESGAAAAFSCRREQGLGWHGDLAAVACWGKHAQHGGN